MTSAEISPTPFGKDVAEAKKSTMLQLTNIDAFYGPSQVLHSVSLEVNQGEIVCLLGVNRLASRIFRGKSSDGSVI